MKISRQIVYSFLFAILFVACSRPSAPAQPENSIDENLTDENLIDGSIFFAEGSFSEEHLCSRGFDLGWMNIDLAAQTPTLEADLTVGVLGKIGAQALIGGIFSPADTFCGIGLSAETQMRLDEIDQLVADGKLDEARIKLDEMLRELQGQTGFRQQSHMLASVLASPSRLGKEDTRRIVRDFLENSSPCSETWS